MRKVLFFVFLLCNFSLQSFSQFTFFNNGSQVFVMPGAVMQVNGNATTNGNMALFQNDGDVTVANSTLQGDFTMQNGSTTKGSGDLKVAGDWINNAVFIANATNTSHVTLNGANQKITGSQSTTFFDLELSGTGIKSQTIDATVSDTLALNDRELATDVHTMFVTNTDPAAITNNQTFGSEGFVSSINPGVLSRVTNSTASYLFPLGSSDVLTRYRPVEVLPNQSGNNTYTGRYINHNCDNDGYLRSSTDTVVCTANDTFYHAILRTQGTDSADIKIHYIPANDGAWINMAHWQTPGGPSPNKWNDMKTTALATVGNYTVMTRPSWKFATPGDPYLLTEAKPTPPTVLGTQAFCAWDTGGVFTATGTGNPGSTFAWSISPANANNHDSIISGQGTNQITVYWDTISGPHIITVTEITANGCATNGSAPYSVSIYPLPQAGYDTTPGGFFGDVMGFTDTSWHASQWFWSFGDEETSTLQNPTHTYSTADTTYHVMLVVTSANGCKDTVYGDIVLGEGLKIPNVFTPNNDGTNDYFYIPSLGIGEFHIKIFNRWGTFIWETQGTKIEWDGRNYSGTPVPDGTYYFILDAKSEKKDYSTTGNVTLIR